MCLSDGVCEDSRAAKVGSRMHSQLLVFGAEAECAHLLWAAEKDRSGR